MTHHTGRQTASLRKTAALAFGLAIGLLFSRLPQAQETRQSCTEGGYMLVMGGIEDRSTVPDADRAARYGPEVWRLVESYGAFYVLRSTPDVVYEGQWPNWKAAVISDWPCRETGSEFWNSEAYQTEVKPLRENAGKYDVGMFNAARPLPPAENQDLVPTHCDKPHLVLILSTITDSEAYGRYGRAVGESGLARRAGLNMLFAGQPVEVLEGTWPENTTGLVSVYPCREAWDAFYNSESYVSEIKPLRENAGSFTIVGFTPERLE